MDLAAAKMIGAGLACIALVGAGIGIGNVFSALISSVARNPAAQGQVQPFAFLGFALAEATGLFGLAIEPQERCDFLHRSASASAFLFGARR